ncbi:MAG: hypothetical protein PHF97_02280 [Bacteroidales bacterium]|nr:hypothetical protein [Bacteroidales bacterium]MDD4602619.1 hypothetical protein [Bacteroidales bacterium]
MKKILFIILSLTFLTACERKIDEFASNANGINFSKFVAVGNSMTAGFADAALYRSGQQNSIPNIMATQFQTVGGGEFRQPLIGTEDGVGVNVIPGGVYCTSKLALKIIPDVDCQGTPLGTSSLKPSFVLTNPDQNMLKQQLLAAPSVPGPYNNMGISGLTLLAAFMPGYAAYNPYYGRFASTASSSVIGEAAAQQPTFFMLWLGDNDALSSALNGTDIQITPADTFAKYYPMAVVALQQSGNNPKGVIATIPDITSLPFFTTISKQLPYNGVTLNAEQASGLNILYTMYGHSDIVWHEGQNPFVYVKSNGKWAQMQDGDLFLLTVPTDSIKCKGMGIADQSAQPFPKPYPIPGKFILDKTEQTNIQTAIAQYNFIIKGVATSQNLALADMNAYLKTLSSGLIFDGIKFSTTFVTGGLFSTDGVHLNPRGNAIAANYFIQAINSHYGCQIPQANITEYKGLVFP